MKSVECRKNKLHLFVIQGFELFQKTTFYYCVFYGRKVIVSGYLLLSPIPASTFTCVQLYTSIQATSGPSVHSIQLVLHPCVQLYTTFHHWALPGGSCRKAKTGHLIHFSYQFIEQLLYTYYSLILINNEDLNYKQLNKCKLLVCFIIKLPLNLSLLLIYC